MGIGAVAGGLVVAGLARTGILPFTVAAAGFGIAILAAALVPSLPGELAALGVVGFFSTAFTATGNTTLQLTADPQFRGRVMALWSVTFTGSTPIGGPVVGVIADDLGPRYGLGLGAVACLGATVIGGVAVSRMPLPTGTPGGPASSTGPPTSKHTKPADDCPLRLVHRAFGHRTGAWARRSPAGCVCSAVPGGVCVALVRMPGCPAGRASRRGQRMAPQFRPRAGTRCGQRDCCTGRVSWGT